MIKHTDSTRENRRLFDIEKYGSDVQLIMTSPPNWYTRWGLFAIFLVIVLVFIVSYFISYPDIVKTNVVLSAHNPTIKFLSKENGRVHFFVKDLDSVHKDEIVGYVENPTPFSEAIKYMKLRAELKKAIVEQDFNRLPTLPAIDLGELQDSYAELFTNINNYKIYILENKLDQNISIINNQKKVYLELDNKDLQETKFHEEVKELGYQKWRRDSLLYSENVISKQELEDSRRNHIPNEITIDEMKKSLKNNELRLLELESTKKNMIIQEAQQLNNLRNMIIMSYNNLEKNFLSWQERFLFVSPANGFVTLFETRNDNEYITQGQELFNITQFGDQNIYAYATLPMQNSAKVKQGMLVNIELASYPANKYGFIKGKIQSISTQPKEGMFYINIEIPKEPITDNHQIIKYDEQMIGTANIITENLRLVERFYYQFKKLLHESKQ